MALVGFIDALGIHVPTYPEILDELKDNFRSIFGPDVYLEADSQEGQMLAMFGLALHDSNQLAVSVYNSFSPQTAQGAGLSRMVMLNGLARQVASNSTVDVTLTGVAGTIITKGVVQDVASQRWNLPPSVTIPFSGAITVTAMAQNLGDIQAAAGDVAQIATPTRGWQSVTNAAAATPGAPVESDATLRQRQDVSTALPSQTVLEGIVGELANLAGVTRYKGYENDSSSEDDNGIPAHAIALVVEGGDDTAIAEAIAVKKTPGSPTHGTTNVVVTDRYGMPNTMHFFRPSNVGIDTAIGIKALAGYVSTTGDAILANLAACYDGLDIGEGVLLSKLYTPINAAEPDPARKTFDVISLAIARHGGAPAASNLVLAFNEAASGTAGTATLTVS